MLKLPNRLVFRAGDMRITRGVLMGIVAFGLAIPELCAQSDNPKFTKTASLPPLQITYSELESVFDKSARFMLSSASTQPVQPCSENVRLKHGETQVEIIGHKLQDSSIKLPEFVTDLTYTALRDRRGTAAVSTISMMFGDYDRRLTVEGHSPQQVDAVFASLKSDLIALSTTVGGTGFRTLTGIVLFQLCLMAVVFSVAYWLGVRKQKGVLFTGLFASILIAILFLIPFDKIFAGFSVSESDPSFVERYASEITLFSLCIGVVSMLLPTILSLLVPKSGVSDAPKEILPNQPSVKNSQKKRSSKK
ncbi:MAG: hypothetical protein ACKVS6_15215 [Planctomycetota bacterium]